MFYLFSSASGLLLASLIATGYLQLSVKLLPAAIQDIVVESGEALFEAGYMPDQVTRLGIQQLMQLRRDAQIADGEGDVEKEAAYVQNFLKDLKSRPIAERTDDANEQHYEVDTRFYDLVLGKHHKYSSALFKQDDIENLPIRFASSKLDEAEERMLRLYAERARIPGHAALNATDAAKKGMRFRLLDLGCGWGSVSLWFAKNYPHIDVVGFSNSATQREYILREAKRRNLPNVGVITGNIAGGPETWNTEGVDLREKFDRVISIEMFEHMKNYEALLEKVSHNFLKDKGLLFVHIFVHKTMPYHFVDQNAMVGNGGREDWMAKHFFSGGTMPSDDLLHRFQKDVTLVDRWRVNGRHYVLTLEAWLQRMDSHEREVMDLFKQGYGNDKAALWFHRWRAFFLACSELFGWNGGNEWFVAHYLFEK